MRIGINALWLLPRMVGGAETYVRGLLTGLSLDLDNEYVLFTNRDNHDTFASVGPNFRRVLFDFPARWDLFSLAVIRGVGEQLYLPRHAARERLDVLHAPLDIAPLAATCPIALTIHDLNFVAVHESRTAAARWLGETLVRVSARRADAIITVSDYSRNEIASGLRILRAKIRVIYNAPSPRPAPASLWPPLAARLRLAPPYLLALSSLNAHKNIDLLLEAYARLPSSVRGQLVVAGHLPQHGVPLPEVARRHGLGESVVFTGYLNDGEMASVMENAHGLAFSSLREGFGIPVVDAMAAGIPVACSETTSLPEVADGAALFFDPLSVEGMAAALERLLVDTQLRERLIAAGRVNARRFSWEETARRTIEVYRALA